MLKFTVSPTECNLRFTCAVCLRFLSLTHAHLSGAVFLSLQPLSRSLPSPHYSLKSSSSVRKLCISRQCGLTFVFATRDRGSRQILQTKLSVPRGAETCTARRGGPHQGRVTEPQVHPPGQHHPPRGLRPGVLFYSPPRPQEPCTSVCPTGPSSAARPVQATSGPENGQNAIPAVTPQTTAGGA